MEIRSFLLHVSQETDTEKETQLGSQHTSEPSDSAPFIRPKALYAANAGIWKQENMVQTINT